MIRLRDLIAPGIALIVVGGTVAVSLGLSRGSSPNYSAMAERAAASFLHTGSMMMRVRSGAITLEARFDGLGNYETTLTGSGAGDGSLLAVGTTWYTRASESSLYAAMTRGTAPLPAGRARLYASRYANRWVNMVGAPSVNPVMNSITAGNFYVSLSGASAVTGRATSSGWEITTGAVQWVLNRRERLIGANEGSTHITLDYTPVGDLTAPSHSVVPPLPVNTSLSPQNYPTELTPVAALYSVLSRGRA